MKKAPLKNCFIKKGLSLRSKVTGSTLHLTSGLKKFKKSLFIFLLVFFIIYRLCRRVVVRAPPLLITQKRKSSSTFIRYSPNEGLKPKQHQPQPVPKFRRDEALRSIYLQCIPEPQPEPLIHRVQYAIPIKIAAWR